MIIKLDKYIRRDLAVSEKALGEDHPSTAITYSNIAGIMSDLGDHDAALEYYKKALSVFKEKLGREHPHTKAVMNSVKKLEENMSCGTE